MHQAAARAPHDARSADRTATRWLSAATCAGAWLGALWLLAGPGRLPFLPDHWAGLLLARFAAGLAAALLLLAACGITAWVEKRAGCRQQQGAMAALAGLAVFAIAFTPELAFSPVFGAALVLLALRTREARTAALGVCALAAALVPAMAPSLPGNAAVLALTGAAALAVARYPRGSRSGRGTAAGA